MLLATEKQAELDAEPACIITKRSVEAIKLGSLGPPCGRIENRTVMLRQESYDVRFSRVVLTNEKIDLCQRPNTLRFAAEAPVSSNSKGVYEHALDLLIYWAVFCAVLDRPSNTRRQPRSFSSGALQSFSAFRGMWVARITPSPASQRRRVGRRGGSVPGAATGWRRQGRSAPRRAGRSGDPH